jgi:hypothetical protein
MVRFQDCGSVFPLPAAARCSFRFFRNPNCHSMQPCRQCLSGTNASSSLNQGEEHGLERILGIGMVRKQLTANRPHKWAMPANEFFERGLVPRLDEPRQQIGVSGSGIRHANDCMEQG